NPKTSIEFLKPFLKSLDMVLVMGVNPGFSGQKFQKSILKKIKQIKKLNSKVLVGVDGGVNLQNTKEITKAGADILSAASVIFKSNDIKKTIEKLNM
ncbi:MAG: ribulose-phosphate 3-epimerase, partial [Patescibacteria group bacterium]|nr:ribulose-phosphate 3-epimerase [Patescibacteria group bacterium]